MEPILSIDQAVVADSQLYISHLDPVSFQEDHSEIGTLLLSFKGSTIVTGNRTHFEELDQDNLELALNGVFQSGLESVPKTIDLQAGYISSYLMGRRLGLILIEQNLTSPYQDPRSEDVAGYPSTGDTMPLDADFLANVNFAPYHMRDITAGVFSFSLIHKGHASSYGVMNILVPENEHIVTATTSCVKDEVPKIRLSYIPPMSQREYGVESIWASYFKDRSLFYSNKYPDTPLVVNNLIFKLYPGCISRVMAFRASSAPSTRENERMKDKWRNPRINWERELMADLDAEIRNNFVEKEENYLIELGRESRKICSSIESCIIGASIRCQYINSNTIQPPAPTVPSEKGFFGCIMKSIFG